MVGEDVANDSVRDLLEDISKDPARFFAAPPAVFPARPPEREFKIASNSPAIPFWDNADAPPGDRAVEDGETAEDAEDNVMENPYV